jgi:hypothetical protein
LQCLTTVQVFHLDSSNKSILALHRQWVKSEALLSWYTAGFLALDDVLLLVSSPDAVQPNKSVSLVTFLARI